MACLINIIRKSFSPRAGPAENFTCRSRERKRKSKSEREREGGKEREIDRGEERERERERGREMVGERTVHLISNFLSAQRLAPPKNCLSFAN
jgi:hypothetical protein